MGSLQEAAYERLCRCRGPWHCQSLRARWRVLLVCRCMERARLCWGRPVRHCAQGPRKTHMSPWRAAGRQATPAIFASACLLALAPVATPSAVYCFPADWLCRWVQAECRGLSEADAPEVNPLLQQAAAALRERPVSAAHAFAGCFALQPDRWHAVRGVAKP